jgi:hypothetical protein
MFFFSTSTTVTEQLLNPISYPSQQQVALPFLLPLAELQLPSHLHPLHAPINSIPRHTEGPALTEPIVDYGHARVTAAPG